MRRRRRKATYGAAVVTALVEMWDIFEQPCGQRLAPILAERDGAARVAAAMGAWLAWAVMVTPARWPRGTGLRSNLDHSPN